jgi:phosphoserine aminotransferase
MARVFNLNAGPATLPLEVLLEAKADFEDFKGTGMSIIEHSHRGKDYDAVHQEAVANYKKLFGCTDNYEVLFVAGGASMQFAMLPFNLLTPGKSADYINSGAWATKAVKEAKIIGKVNVIADCSKEIPTRVPRLNELKFSENAAYVHLTSNETISGAQWKEFPKTAAPLVADMSSDILSKPFDLKQFGLIYAGAQKNLGPSGIAIVVIRKDLAEQVSENVPVILRYKTYIEENSLYNTPPTFSIYIMMLVSRWILKQGLENIYKRNEEKARKLYAEIDKTGFYRGTAVKECRSNMNVTFRLPTEALEEQFIKEASKAGLKGLKGHRSVGGLRASIYNAFPMEGVDVLVSFMQEFERKNG